MALDYSEYLKQRSPFVKLLGLQVIKLDNGYCQCSLEIKETFLNVHKAVHGGVIYPWQMWRWELLHIPHSRKMKKPQQ